MVDNPLVVFDEEIRPWTLQKELTLPHLRVYNAHKSKSKIENGHSISKYTALSANISSVIDYFGNYT